MREVLEENQKGLPLQMKQRKEKTPMKNIITTSIRFFEDRHDVSTGLDVDLLVCTPRKRLKKYSYRAKFEHRIRRNRSTHEGWPARKESVAFSLVVPGVPGTFTQKADVPSEHKKIWDYMQQSAPIIFEKNKFCLSLHEEAAKRFKEHWQE